MTKRMLLPLLLAPFVAACGSNHPTTSTGGGSADNPAGSAYTYARCMRSHGVPNFPDPHVKISGNSAAVGFRVDPSITGSPKFKSAGKACNSILPAPSGNNSSHESGPGKQVLLAFARCMRSKGIQGFPDPDAQGQLRLPTVVAAGVDIHSRQFLSAATSCVGVTHGQITAAQIRAGVNGTQ